MESLHLLRLLGDHLWQSTWVAGGAALVALAFRRYGAHVRYWIWFGASVKWLIPFAWLIAIGSSVAWPAPSPRLGPAATTLELMAQPFSAVGAAIVEPVPRVVGPAAVPFPSQLAIAILVVWLCGAVTILIGRIRAWRRIAAIVRRSTAMRSGREEQALRAVVARMNLRTPIRLAASSRAFEPGVFGIVRPILLWPAAMTDRLDDAQLEAIVAHEASHVRRRDNLTAAIHIASEALFWFHPFVWWIGARLVAEREAACDQTVLRLGAEPHHYAESILTTCEYCAASPLACVTGVTGADLKQRIQAIMSGRSAAPLGRVRAVALTAAAAAVVVGPIGLGVVRGPTLRAATRADITDARLLLQRRAETFTIHLGDRSARDGATAAASSQGAPQPSAVAPPLYVATIKPSASVDERSRLSADPGGRVIGINITLKTLIRQAYRVTEQEVFGGPGWMDQTRFDLAAKLDGEPTIDRMQDMLRALLEERFALAVHREARMLPVYTLAVHGLPLGEHIHPAAIDCAALVAASGGRLTPPPPEVAGRAPMCGIRFGPGSAIGTGVALSQLASNLSRVLGRPVVDRTGLAGGYDFDLRWSPDPLLGHRADAAAIDSSGPSIFTALQEQLGLTLEADRAPIDVLVIDRANTPTEN
jgi:uncharacterized protein (TIGR03435 family)